MTDIYSAVERVQARLNEAFARAETAEAALSHEKARADEAEREIVRLKVLNADVALTALDYQNKMRRAVAVTDVAEIELTRLRAIEAAGRALVKLHDNWLKAHDGFMGNQADAYYQIAKQFAVWNAAREALALKPAGGA